MLLAMITVYYDGKCGLCSREINYYRKIVPPGLFNWRDATEHQKALESVGITLPDALKALLAFDENGRIHKGVDAFIIIWKNLK